MLESIFDLLHSNGVPEDVSYWREVQRKSQHYLAHVLTPLGRFPPVGDSEELELAQELAQTPEVRYTVSLGKEGTPPSTLDELFPDAGDMVFRDTWAGTYHPPMQSISTRMPQCIGASGIAIQTRCRLSSTASEGGGFWKLVSMATIRGRSVSTYNRPRHTTGLPLTTRVCGRST